MSYPDIYILPENITFYSKNSRILIPDPDIYKVEVLVPETLYIVSSQSGQSHLVSTKDVTKPIPWSCSCDSFIFKHNPSNHPTPTFHECSCKHIRLIHHLFSKIPLPNIIQTGVESPSAPIIL